MVQKMLQGIWESAGMLGQKCVLRCGWRTAATGWWSRQRGPRKWAGVGPGLAGRENARGKVPAHSGG